MKKLILGLLVCSSLALPPQNSHALGLTSMILTGRGFHMGYGYEAVFVFVACVAFLPICLLDDGNVDNQSGITAEALAANGISDEKVVSNILSGQSALKTYLEANELVIVPNDDMSADQFVDYIESNVPGVNLDYVDHLRANLAQ